MRKALLAGVVCALGAMAQETKVERDVVVRRSGVVAGVAGEGMTWTQAIPGPGVHVMMANPSPIKGAPYAAEAVTERIQVLQDGNRIVERSSSKQYRDSEGRTRMENVIGPTAAFVPAEGKMSLVFIDDPVAGVHYTLRPDDKTAEKMTMPKIVHAGPETASVGMRKEMFVTATAEAGAAGIMHGPAVMVYSRNATGANVPSPTVNKTSLGKRIIEGVEAEGTKMVETIPAGAMGNERPIESVSEIWYSNDLKTDVLRKHSDPRFGETSFKLTSVIRGEQPRSLFEPPADYKINESKMRMKIDKFENDKKE